jgi:uncharacterized protein
MRWRVPYRLTMIGGARVERTNGWPGSRGEHQLQQEYGTTDRAHRFYSQQALDRLNDRMREFVAEQEMMFVATADGKGECDNTFRAGPPGFVQVLGEDRLVWPEYRGNGVMASIGNITENAHVGLLFIDFFRQVIGLPVNGHAQIVDDDAMRAAHPDLPVETAPGRRPERWVVVYVEEAYIHCAKHIPRLAKVSRERAWGTDDVRRKGGDFFGAAAEPRPWTPEEAPVAALAALAAARHVGRVKVPRSVGHASGRVEPVGYETALECSSPRHRVPRGRNVLLRLIGRDADRIEE